MADVHADAETVENLRDLRERAHLGEMLQKLTEEVAGTLAADEILQRALATAALALGAPTAALLVRDGMEWVVRAQYGGLADETGRRFSDEELPFARTMEHDRHAVAVDDAFADPHVNADVMRDDGIRAFLAVPLVLRGRVFGVMRFDYRPDPVHFRQPQLDFASRVAVIVALGLENARLFTQLQDTVRSLAEKDRQIRAEYVAVFAAITGARLVLVTQDEIDAELGGAVGRRGMVSVDKDLSQARADILGTLRAQGVEDPEGFLIAIGEALANAVKHATWATYQVRRLDGVVQVEIRDDGPGIDFHSLPQGALVPGYSTQPTVGMGFTLMLGLSQRLLLATGPSGTTVLLETKAAEGAA